ncbi:MULTISPECIES: hypothetical protein [Flavobacterium]|uniref:hypothetical protein n=1 Tax=Flavobacterium TaxID=237 RepID=UPI001FCC7021|nr:MULTISPECIES: hypothetical protein [Flavobacterium]UOK42170.1 hypothetical protein LZF87_12730 [Flavobacterium enshiense]
MDIFEIIFGRGLLEVTGGLIRFAIDHFCARFTRKNVKPLSSYFKEGKDEVFTNSAGNHVVGVIFFGIVILALIIAMSPAGRTFFN